MLVGGCGGATPADAVDAHWAAMMVPHHRAGMALDDLALRRTDDVRVRHLAFEMNGYQGRELDDLARMAGSAPPADYAAMAEGMPSDADLARLATLDGAVFDRTFLTLMIRHHEGAVAMADDEVSGGRSAGARRLASAVATVQREQLDRLRALLSELG